MRWSYWGASGEVPEEVGQLRQEGFQSTAWKGTHIPTYVYAFCSTLATHGLRVFSLVWRCIGHIVRPKLKQNGGICSPRQFRTSVSLEIDVDCTEKRKLSLQWSITG